MRGKDQFCAVVLRFVGITPAYAGKSELVHQPEKYFEDHPCVCGEKFINFLYFFSNQGSPLRMRGKVLDRPHLP